MNEDIGGSEDRDEKQDCAATCTAATQPSTDAASNDTESIKPAVSNEANGENIAADSAAGVKDDESGAANAAAESKGSAVRKHRRSVPEMIKRYAVLCFGLLIMSFGVGLSIKAQLGTSPISSIPNVLNIITTLSVGVTTIIFNVLIVVLQIIILRKKFDPIQLIQIPVCVVFGFLCDFALWCMPNVAPAAYWQDWLICIAGILLVAFGVSCEVAGGVATLAGEGLVLALCRVTPVKFGYMKVICDSSFVVIAVALILIFGPEHKLQGVREGTVAAAILVGLIAKQFNKFMKPLANLFYYGKKGAPQEA